MKRNRRVKIHSHPGPCSSDQGVIEELARAGADVFRINMSHASHEVLHETVAKIRAVENPSNTPWHSRRPAGAQAPGRALPMAPSCLPRVKPSPSTRPMRPATRRVHLPHRNPFGCKPANACCSMTARSSARHRHLARSDQLRSRHGGKLSDPRASRCRYRARVGVLTDKDRADLKAALGSGRWIALLRPAPRGHHRGQKDRSGPRGRPRQDRKAPGHRPARGDHPAFRLS